MREEAEVGDTPDAFEVVVTRFPRDPPPFAAAVMVAWREVSSCIMRSFCSCLSAWTV